MESVYDSALRVLEKYGIATVFACALLWIGRNDVIVPLVAAHSTFLQIMATTQCDIAITQKEQTRFLAEIHRIVSQEKN